MLKASQKSQPKKRPRPCYPAAPSGTLALRSAQTLLSALGRHAPDILQACHQAIKPPPGTASPRNPAGFEACRSESIDYAVMEHHANVAVLPFASAWSDVGNRERRGRPEPARRARQPHLMATAWQFKASQRTDIHALAPCRGYLGHARSAVDRHA
jgi:hypothetical protein